MNESWTGGRECLDIRPDRFSSFVLGYTLKDCIKGLTFYIELANGNNTFGKIYTKTSDLTFINIKFRFEVLVFDKVEE